MWVLETGHHFIKVIYGVDFTGAFLPRDGMEGGAAQIVGPAFTFAYTAADGVGFVQGEDGAVAEEKVALLSAANRMMSEAKKMEMPSASQIGSRHWSNLISSDSGDKEPTRNVTFKMAVFGNAGWWEYAPEREANSGVF